MTCNAGIGGVGGGGSSDDEPLHIAIILNSYRSRFLPAIRASYVRTIGTVAPNARLDFFEPANRPGDLPADPTAYDLVVLGGGNVDPRKSWPWMLDVHAFVRRLVAEHPTQKLLGICWGHQTIARVFGGKVVDSAMPEMGVADVRLTERGQSFFFPGEQQAPQTAPPSSIRLQQHHRREVAAAAPGFVALAEDNQCLVHERSNAILTFQGHPEKDAETARLRLHDASRWFGLDESSPYWQRLREMMDMEHDGDLVWHRIFAWVRQRAVSPQVQEELQESDCNPEDTKGESTDSRRIVVTTTGVGEIMDPSWVATMNSRRLKI